MLRVLSNVITHNMHNKTERMSTLISVKGKWIIFKFGHWKLLQNQRIFASKQYSHAFSLLDFLFGIIIIYLTNCHHLNLPQSGNFHMQPYSHFLCDTVQNKVALDIAQL